MSRLPPSKLVIGKKTPLYTFFSVSKNSNDFPYGSTYELSEQEFDTNYNPVSGQTLPVNNWMTDTFNNTNRVYKFKGTNGANVDTNGDVYATIRRIGEVSCQKNDLNYGDTPCSILVDKVPSPFGGYINPTPSRTSNNSSRSGFFQPSGVSLLSLGPIFGGGKKSRNIKNKSNRRKTNHRKTNRRKTNRRKTNRRR